MDFSVVVLLVFGVAVLYSSVGHGGASGYLAVLALAGLAPKQVSATALILNVVVSLIAFWSFSTFERPRLRLILPLLCGSIPFAFLGGRLAVSDRLYYLLLAFALGAAALRLLLRSERIVRKADPQVMVLLAIGIAVGLLSGIVGVGGGIFLSPIILLAGWAAAKETSATSALFILLNSLAGLAARGSAVVDATIVAGPYLGAAIAGGILGSMIGSRKLQNVWLCRALGGVLLMAAVKLALKG